MIFLLIPLHFLAISPNDFWANHPTNFEQITQRFAPNTSVFFSKSPNNFSPLSLCIFGLQFSPNKGVLPWIFPLVSSLHIEKNIHPTHVFFLGIFPFDRLSLHYLRVSSALLERGWQFSWRNTYAFWWDNCVATTTILFLKHSSYLAISNIKCAHKWLQQY